MSAAEEATLEQLDAQVREDFLKKSEEIQLLDELIIEINHGTALPLATTPSTRPPLRPRDSVAGEDALTAVAAAEVLPLSA